MTSLRAVFIFTLSLLALPAALSAQGLIPGTITPLAGGRRRRGTTWPPGTAHACVTNGVTVVYGEAVLTARQILANPTTRSGRGRRPRRGSKRASSCGPANTFFWYDFKTRQIEAEQFRTGEPPMFAQGQMLTADITNRVSPGP